MQRLVGPECYQTVLAKNSQIALKLISSFEPQKRLLTKDDFDNDYCFASIDIPSEIYSEMSPMQKSLIKQREYQVIYC